MAKGKTLWEMLTGWLSGKPAESRFYNPLGTRVGHAVMIDTVELRDLHFFIRELRAYRRTIGGKEFPFADYVLLARPLGGEDVVQRLRLVPAEDPERTGRPPHDALLLSLHDEMGYTKELHDVVRDTTGLFQVHQDGALQEEYRRVNDVATPYKAEVSVLADVNKDGKVQMSEVQTVQVEYWDYWREIKDAAGQPVPQYLFVEMDTTTGWFQLWRGEPIDPRKVVVM